MSEKPTVLVLGGKFSLISFINNSNQRKTCLTPALFQGCGFIGRNLVHYLVKNDLASEIRVVDKTPPQMAYLNAQHLNSFDNPLVDFVSANLINPGKFFFS